MIEIQSCDAQLDKPGFVVITLNGCIYRMEVSAARVLHESLKLAINAACLICDDCGTKNNTVESSGCPDAIKHGEGKRATLCDECFHRRDMITE